MQKMMFVACLGLACSLGLAQQQDQDGRIWITASEVQPPKISAKTKHQLAEKFKQLVIQDNNLNKCLFPEIYQSDDENEILDKWWSDTEETGRMKRSHYLKLKMRLAQKILPPELADDFLNDRLSHNAEQAYKQAKKRYHKTVTANTKKACEKISKYATNLIEEYDESNQEWQNPFPNP